MFKVAVAIVLLLFAVGIPSAEANVIAKQQLIEMFDGMTKQGRLDPSKPLLWGYFFTDTSKEPLERAAQLLKKEGYRIVDVYLSDKEHPGEADLWWLHVEKIEVHTPETLDIRNQELNRFAQEQGLGSYDGMDVGPATRAN